MKQLIKTKSRIKHNGPETGVGNNNGTIITAVYMIQLCKVIEGRSVTTRHACVSSSINSVDRPERYVWNAVANVLSGRGKLITICTYFGVNRSGTSFSWEIIGHFNFVSNLEFFIFFKRTLHSQKSK